MPRVLLIKDNTAFSFALILGCDYYVNFAMDERVPFWYFYPHEKRGTYQTYRPKAPVNLHPERGGQGAFQRNTGQ
jgi:hypothetical protein